MSIILGIFIVLCLYKVKIVKDNTSYLSISHTTQVNGIFVFLIFMSHFVTYIDDSAVISEAYMSLRYFLKQLVVVPFLFYSGYGMYESYKKRGQDYIDSLIKRFLKLFFQFDLAVLCYFLLRVFLQKQMSIRQIVLSFLGWNGLGNSYWYVFVILCLYVCMYVSFKVFKNRPTFAIIMMWVLSIGLIQFFIVMDKTSNWYNTLCTFTFGMTFSYCKEQFENLYTRYRYILFFGCLLLFIFTHQKMFDSLIAYEIMSITFCVLIVLISRVIVLDHPVLLFLGKHTFSIYILQRIWMILFQEMGLNVYVYCYFVICLVLTILSAVVFDRYVGFLIKRVFH